MLEISVFHLAGEYRVASRAECHLLIVECESDLAFLVKEISKFISLHLGAERGFCSQCGSHLFYKLKQNNQYFVPVGLFDNFEGLVFEH
ncbi:GFA family protein [Nostoc sp. UHCC 0302]|uniref:GFA family protein n=1 Tax=Nostoc sp. UHCC 0302 TaxID=3134896 RepID=UPI00311CDE4C